MLTRGQAAATWCPMVRVARNEVIEERSPTGGGMELVSRETHVVGGCNSASGMGRGPRNPISSRCIADQCSMWRWADREVSLREPATWWPQDDYPQVEPARPAEVPGDAVWIPLTGDEEEAEGGYWTEPSEKIDAEYEANNAGRRGYCGLAGAPVIFGGQ